VRSDWSRARVPKPDFEKNKNQQGEKMPEKIDLQKMDEACTNLSLIRRSLGFVADHVEDDQTMAILMRLEASLEETENLFFEIHKKWQEHHS
jgi:hypothetical protein